MTAKKRPYLFKTYSFSTLTETQYQRAMKAVRERHGMSLSSFIERALKVELAAAQGKASSV